jgi:pimeloyl-ACP methyl ester carboxylesterase
MDQPSCKKVVMKNRFSLNVLHIECENNSSTERDLTVFFIHGSMGSLTQYNDLIAFYKGRAHVVAYDTMGCGDSEKPSSNGEYSTDSLTANSIEIFEKYATARNILVGHSYGTAQVARLCSHFRDQNVDISVVKAKRDISGVVLLGTVDFTPKGGPPALGIFSLPLFLLRPMQGFMSKAYVGMAFSPNSNPALKERALLRAGNQ